MHSLIHSLASTSISGWILLGPVLAGSAYVIISLFTTARFRALTQRQPEHSFEAWPPVTILKPVHGLEKNQRENLRSTCIQDYPEFQVVFSVQELDDPVIPLLRELQEEFGQDRVTLAIENKRCGTNGKINNMIGGLPYARNEILVISDSDVRLRPDYLKTIVGPLSDPSVGCVCTLYKGALADSWYEKVELLTLNADFLASAVFAHTTGAVKFCIGASTALRRSVLEEIGGLEALANYLVEDHEMGRRIWMSGKRLVVVPYIVDTIMDLRNPEQWWSHQVYWDQNHRSARPLAYLSTIIIRSVPFALLFALINITRPFAWGVLVSALFLRMGTAAVNLGWGLRDREGLRSIWLLPFRDIAGFVSYVLAYTKRTTIWRGTEYTLTRDGRLLVRGAKT